jgi:hypothetical protein
MAGSLRRLRRYENAMKRISKNFLTSVMAEMFQSKLYDKYNHVRLVQFPRSSEEGEYVWEVKE